jgi:hypothetical protein
MPRESTRTLPPILPNQQLVQRRAHPEHCFKELLYFLKRIWHPAGLIRRRKEVGRDDRAQKSTFPGVGKFLGVWCAETPWSD